MQNQDQISQKQIFGKELLRLKNEVTSSDRYKAKIELDLTNNTISQYLNGTVRDCDTAAKLILFFKRCINQRNLVLLDSVLEHQVAEVYSDDSNDAVTGPKIIGGLHG